MSDFDFGRYVAKALDDPAMYEAACKEAGELIGSWKWQDNRRDYIRVSDAGHCVRERWATFHDMLDVPKDFKGELKMLNGSLMGAMQAALFKQAYLAENPDKSCVLEVVSGLDGDEPGHTDILLFDRVVELKSNFTWQALGMPPSYNKLQAKKYAVQAEKPLYSIHRLSLAVKEGGRFERTDTFDVTDEVNIDREYKRLQAALNDEPPEGDPVEPWRCAFCRAGWCEKNVNPLKEMIGV
jgi:hypothetical protein